jgi:hypothetical protein
MQGMTVNGVNTPFSYDAVQLFVWHHLHMALELTTMQPLVLTSTKQWHPKLLLSTANLLPWMPLKSGSTILVLLHVSLSSRL